MATKSKTTKTKKTGIKKVRKIVKAKKIVFQAAKNAIEFYPLLEVKSKYDATIPEHWLNCPEVPNALKAKVSAMTPEETKKAFAKNELAFGTAGIRGKMGPGTQYLNKFVYQQMAAGYCHYILTVNPVNPLIVIGHDNRNHSDEFALECANIAKRMGIKVYLFENNKLMPTPIISYTIRRLKATGGINITASHNPKEDNGFKAYNSTGSQILPDEAKIIVRNMPKSKDILDLASIIPQAKTQKPISYVSYDQITDEFFRDVIRNATIDKDFLNKDCLIKKQPIVFTGHHGTTSELMPKFLKSLGFKKIYVVPTQAKISSQFEGSPISNPEDNRSFEAAMAYADKKKATIIFGADPDGDRMAIGFKKTNRWRFLNGNEMGIIYTYYILTHANFDKTPYILSTHMSTNYIDRIAKKHNAKVIRTKTGFKWMCNLIDEYEKEGRMVVAFEEAIGALVHTACRDKDSFGAVCLALEIYNNVNSYYVDLHDYIQERIFSKYGHTFSATHSFVVDSNDWKADAKKMMDLALNFRRRKLFDYTIQKIEYQEEADAVKWTLDKDSWIKFRISGTEPKFKVYFCLNNQMVGQLKSAGSHNLEMIKKEILGGFKLK